MFKSNLSQLIGRNANLNMVNFALAATAFSLIWGGFLFYSRFFSNSTLSLADKGLNSNFHYIHISLIKTKCWLWQLNPNTTNDLKEN